MAATQTPSLPFKQALHNIVGRSVCVTTVDGSRYEGVAHTIELHENGGGVVMFVVCKQGRLEDKVVKAEQRRVFKLDEIVRLDCAFSVQEDLAGTRTQVLNEVRADTEISTGQHGKERELQAWKGDDSVHASDVNLDDWDDATRKKHLAGWDQFTVNEQKFGVTTTYDENLYTTQLDRRAVSKEAELTAAKLAAEIEGTAAPNALLAEERGQEVPENEQYDEEARYSTVLRGDEAGVHLKAGASTADGAKPAAPAPAVASDAPPVADVKKSTLNPNAKPFSFNPKAKEFVPSAMGTAAGPGAMRPGAAAGMGAYGCAAPFPGGGASMMAVMPGGAMAPPGHYSAAAAAGMGMAAPGAFGRPPQAYMVPGAQPFTGAAGTPGQVQMTASMGLTGAMAGQMGAQGMVRGPPSYPMPPQPPGVMYPAGVQSGMQQRMAAQMRGGMQAPPAGFAAAAAASYQMNPGMAAPGAQQPIPGATSPNFAGGPQPPRQNTFPAGQPPAGAAQGAAGQVPMQQQPPPQ